MPPRRLSIGIPSSASLARPYPTNHIAYATNAEARRTLEAQRRRYFTNKQWTEEYDKYNKMETERNFRNTENDLNRRGLCRRFTNAVDGTIKYICGIQRKRTRKLKHKRNLTRRVR
jgi:hypothetical protein